MGESEKRKKEVMRKEQYRDGTVVGYLEFTDTSRVYWECI